MTAPAPMVSRIGRTAFTRLVSGTRSRRADTALVALFVGLVLFVMAFTTFSPADPTLPVGPAFVPPGFEFWAGTDAVGRDVFARIMHAARLSLYAALVIILASVAIGAVVGTIAGAVGGIVDTILMRVTDLFLALPAPVLAIAVASAFGRSFEITLAAVAAVWWPLYARVVRGEVRSIMARSHVEAARSSGSRGLGLLVRHVLPGTVPPVLVAISLDVGMVITTLAGLSFLGLGSPEPRPELGAMAAQGMSYLLSRWWIPIMPALMVFVIAYSANLAGDGLRDLLGRRS